MGGFQTLGKILTNMLSHENQLTMDQAHHHITPPWSFVNQQRKMSQQTVDHSHQLENNLAPM